jgi:KaiC/GvpD/RAD55 family RecA-like ATPase
MALRVDFGGSYNESQQRKANEIYVKIQNTFSKFEMFDKDFFELMKTNIDGYYFSSANFDRTAENRNKVDKLIRNIFLRPRIDSEFSQMLEGNGFILIGDVFINPREEKSYFSVNDFYLCENSSQMEYEVFANAPINLRTLYDEWDLRQTNTVLNLDLISELPYIVSPIKFKRFIKKWESYLEFEYELTKMGIKYKTIKNLRFDVLYEVNAKEINRDTYKNDILVEFEKKLYVKENSQYLTGEENQYVFASIELDKSSDLKSFFNQSLSLVAKRRTGLLDKLINGEDVEDIVQVPLGEFLMSKDTEFKTTIAYFYVPDAIDDEGNADLASFREANKHTLDDDPVLASTATGDIALYKRGKAAIDNMKKGKVKKPFLVGLLIDPAHFESHVEFYNEDNVEFALEKKLNSSQKAAIIKALNSNSIFALQGPPGTGKTQTITELVYQYNKMGKKVLISSQTHIAIDNVIERLPHEMNILPIRLVKDTKRANVKYLPDKLLDNLYESAYDKFSEKIENYNNFSKEIDAIQAHFESNKELYSNIKSRQQKCDKLNDEISGLRKESQIYADQLLELEREEKKAQANKKFLLEYYNNELDFNKITEDIYNEKYYEMLESLFKELGFDEEESITDHILMLKRRIGTTRIELLNELSNGKTGKSKEYIDIEKQIEDQKNAIKALEAMNNPSLASAIETTSSSINSLLRKLKDLDEDGGEKIVDLSNTTFYFVKDKSNPEMAISEEIKHINNANEL